MDVVQYAMDRIGLRRPSWRTLIVSATREAALPTEALWDTFTRLETWPLWSAPLHVGTRWLSNPDWAEGATFEQTLELGSPFGPHSVDRVTIGAIEPGRMVAWWRTEGAVKTCHVWEFAEVAPGRTRVTDAEVLHGLPIGLVKPLVRTRWRRLFEASVAGLEAAAKRGRAAALAW
jgi:hypothetical protein